MITLTYADVPLLLEDPGFEFQVWLERTLSLHDLNLFSGTLSPLAEGQQLSRSSEIQVGLPVPGYSTQKPPRWKINTLWWPTGAARHAVGLFLVSNDNLAKITESLKGGSGSHAVTTADFVFGDEENGEITSPMYMLPPRRVTNVEGEESCGLICLVDERYYWQRRGSGELSLDNNSTWKDLFNQLNAALDIDLEYLTIDDDYGRPDPVEFSRRHQSAALILDAAAVSVGLRVVRTLEGDVYLDNPKEASKTYDNKIEGTEIIGGGLSGEPSQGRFPGQVRVVFPRRVDCDLIDPVGEVYVIEVSASEVDYSGETTSYDTKVFRTTAIAEIDGTDPDEPTNKDALDKLAKKVVTDYYAWLGKQYDISFAGLVAWEPNGFDDWVWWHAGYQNRVEHSQLQRRRGDDLNDLPLQIRDQDYSILTRVSSHPSDFGVTNQLQQLVDYEFRPPTMIVGRVKASTSESEGTIQLEHVRLIYGVDPRPLPRTSDQIVPIPNTHAQSYGAGTTVLAWQQCEDGEFITERFGGGADIVRYIHTKDMAAGDLDGEARLLVDEPGFWNTVASATERLALEVQDASDNGFDTGKVKVGEWVKQTTPEGFFRYDGDQSNTTADDPDDWFEFSELGIEIRIVDREEATIAYGPYVDCAGNGEESVDADPDANPPVEAVPGEGGFRGKAYQFTADYDDTGVPGYYIVSVESLVPFVFVELVDDNNGFQPDSLRPKYLGDTDPPVAAVGSGEQNRLPKKEFFPDSGSQGNGVDGVANVTDPWGKKESASEGDKWLLGLQPRSDEYSYLVTDTAGTGGGSVDIDIVLIDEDIEGAEENSPQQFVNTSDITLTAQEISDGYTVVFQDPPDDDYTQNTTGKLPLTSYTRTIVELKYYEGSPIAGVAAAGGVATITLETGSSSTDDFYVDDTITVNGETKTVTGYVGATRVATVASDWVTPPVADDAYVINSSKNLGLAKEIIDDAANHKKIVRHKTKSIRYDDGKPFLMGQYTRSDYPGYDENAAFPPSGLDAGFLNKKYRGIALNGVLITVLCKALPPPELPE